MTLITGRLVMWDNKKWLITAVLKWDHKTGEPVMVELRRSIMVDSKRRFLDRAVYERVAYSDIEVINTP